MAGQRADFIGNSGLPHTYSYVPDIAAGLATLGTDGPADGLTTRRRIAGFAVAAAGLPLATALLSSLRGQLSLASDILTVMVVAAAIVAGFWPGIAAAVAGFLLLNYYFTQPYHTFAISHPDEVLALVVFVVVAAAVSAVVGLAARRTGRRPGPEPTPRCCSTWPATCCARARADRPTGPAAGDLRAGIGHAARTPPRHPAHPRPPARPGNLAGRRHRGGKLCTTPDEGDTDIPVGEDLALVLRGRPCPPPTGASWKPSPPRRRLRCASSGWPKRPNAPAP